MKLSCFYFVALSMLFSVGCRDSRVNSLQQRVAVLEDKVSKLEANLKNSADEENERHTNLMDCVSRANSDYDSSIRSNGQKRRDGTYDLPLSLMGELRRQKQDKIEECKLLYGK